MDQVIAEILKAGFLGALLLLQGWYFIRKEEMLFTSLENKDKSRRVEEEKHQKAIIEMNDRMVDMITEHSRAIAQISETIECLGHMMQQFEISAKEQRYLRLILEKQIGLRSPGNTEKFYAPEHAKVDL